MMQMKQPGEYRSVWFHQLYETAPPEIYDWLVENIDDKQHGWFWIRAVGMGIHGVYIYDEDHVLAFKLRFGV